MLRAACRVVAERIGRSKHGFGQFRSCSWLSAHSPGCRRIIRSCQGHYHYYLLMQEVVRFLKTGASPIDIGETLGIIAFLEAADQSREQGGRTIQVALS